MHKVTSFFSLFIAILATFFLVAESSYARNLTTEERKAFGQSNIIFYEPCDDADDCGPDSSTTTNPDNPSNPDNPDTPSDPETPSSPEDPGDAGDPLTPSGSGASLIVSTARAMTWPTTAGTCKNGSGNYVGWKPNYAYGSNENKPCHSTINDYLSGLGYRAFQDCGKFVGAVIRHSVDSSFTASGVRNQIPYMQRSSNWTKVSTDGRAFSMSNLKPGDIIAASESGHGHIMIWIGGQNVPCATGRCYVNVASSSQGTRSPSLNKITKMVYCWTSGQSDCPPYKIFRWTGN